MTSNIASDLHGSIISKGDVVVVVDTTDLEGYNTPLIGQVLRVLKVEDHALNLVSFTDSYHREYYFFGHRVIKLID